MCRCILTWNGNLMILFQTEAACTLTDLSRIFEWLFKNNKLDALNIGLQAVGNMIVQHRDNQLKVWNTMGSLVRLV